VYEVFGYFGTFIETFNQETFDALLGYL